MNPPVDDVALIEGCEREPIRMPGAIQAHGAMLVVDAETGRVTHASENIGDYIGRDVDAVLGCDRSELGAVGLAQALLDGAAGTLGGSPVRLEVPGRHRPRAVDVFVHGSGEKVLVEMEDVDAAESGADFDRFHIDVRSTLERLQAAGNLDEVFETVLSMVRDLTGFDRVMLYRFEPDDHGEVVAELRRDDLEPFLGLHYPASDIPAQARALYLEQWLRLIPDADASAVHVLGLAGEADPQALDLSRAVFRAVSPVHLEYLANMGVRASMSISLLVDGRLWGLVACHHYAGARVVPYGVRASCEVLGIAASIVIGREAAARTAQYRLALNGIVTDLLERMAAAPNIPDGLLAESGRLMELARSTGVAMRIDGAEHLAGSTPSPTAVRRIRSAIADRIDERGTFATESLALEAEALADVAETASGVLVMSLSPDHESFVMWFRPERSRTVRWAGAPQKEVERGDDGVFRLAPRASFAVWAETVRHRSEPWAQPEIDAVVSFRAAIGSFLLERAGQLARVNAELERSNAELDAFACGAAHDLKEPLRGIHTFADFLIEDYANVLDEDGTGHLETIRRLSERMDSLLESLLKYSRVGRPELERTVIDFRGLVDDAAELVGVSLAARGAKVAIQGSGSVVGDRVQLVELLANLLTNAVKYNDRSVPRIEVTLRKASQISVPVQVHLPADALVISVSDDGIGIDAQHHADIFRVFRRLHLADEYGGGTGAGLTIVRRIVERHGGVIWVESSLGEGACFYVALGSLVDE